jgi:hypothetical protein
MSDDADDDAARADVKRPCWDDTVMIFLLVSYP